MKKDLGNCTLELLDTDMVRLFIKPEQVLTPTDVHHIFETIHSDFPEAKKLVVTAGRGATLNPEAREVVSSEEITDQIIADAIVTEEFSHQMSSNFFVRFNRPSRPTRLFKTLNDAKQWLKNL